MYKTYYTICTCRVACLPKKDGQHGSISYLLHVFKQMIKLSHPLDKCKESTVHLKFTYEEMNALHYAAGYISAKSNKEKVSPPTEGGRPSTRKLGAPSTSNHAPTGAPGRQGYQRTPFARKLIRLVFDLLIMTFCSGMHLPWTS